MANSRRPDAIVVGAGLHGLSTALHLARAGLKPLVLEKDHPGRHASGVNAGGVRRLGRHLAEVPLSVAALTRWQAIGELVGDDCGFTACGQLQVAENEAELAGLQKRAAELRAAGFDHEEIIGAAELKQLVPDLAPHCVGAVWCRDDGAAHPFRTVTAFRRKVEALGVEIRSATAVGKVQKAGADWQVETATGRCTAPILINAAGAWGNAIAAQLGEPVPLSAEAPMLMITEPVAPFLTPVLGACGRTLSFKQFDNGTLLIGGGHRGQARPAENRTTLHHGGLRTSAQTVQALFPRLRDVRVVRAWAGIEGILPDAIPVIGPSGTEAGAYHLFGFSAHGFQLAPITGQIIADLVLQGHTPLPIEAFDVGRFGAQCQSNSA